MKNHNHDMIQHLVSAATRFRSHPPAFGRTPLTPRRPTVHTSQRGFSLLEVLIALIIAGIALGTVFRATTETIRATAAAARYQEAISRARSHLDGIGANLVAGEQTGDDGGGGFHWRVLVRAVDSTGKQDSAGRPVANTDMLVITLYAITIWITWQEEVHVRTVRLDSERLLTSAPN
jgi:general secretion pathway protein I